MIINIFIILPDCVLSVYIEGDMLSVVMKLSAGHQTLSGHRSDSRPARLTLGRHGAVSR